MTRSGEPVLRRVGVIGDLHCEDGVLEPVLLHFLRGSADTVLAVGDIVDGTGDVNKVCSLLVQHGVLTVAGNHDRWILTGSMRELADATAISALSSDSREWLAQLPKTRSFQTPRGRLLLCHGLGENDMAMLEEDEGYDPQSTFALQELVQSGQYRFVVCGHSHKPMVRNIGPLTIINAGTLRRGGRQVCSIIDFTQGSVEFFNVNQGQISGAERFMLP